MSALQKAKSLSDGKPDMSLPKEICMVATIAMAQLLTQASLAQNLMPLKTIGATFGVENDVGQMSWTVAAYSLTVGIFVLPSGRLGDLYGHRRMLFGGFIWFGLWTLIAGLSSYSRSVIFFDFCRSMQGIGPAVCLPNAVAILGRVYQPGNRKNLAFSFFACTAPNGFLLGAVFASLLTVRASWQFAFYIEAIVCFLMAALVILAIPADEPRSKEEGLTFDYLGTALAIPGLVLINFAWNQAPIVGWHNPYTYSLLVVGLILITAFFYVEGTVKDPLIPKSIWNLSTSITCAALSLGWASFGVFVYYFVRFLQDLRNQSYLITTAQLAPAGPMGLVASLLCSYLLPRIGAMPTMTVSLMAFLATDILFATVPVDQIYWGQTFVAILIAPLGMDLSYPSSSIIVSDAVPREHQGVASSLVNTIVNYSISIGLGFAGTVEAYTNEGNLETGYRRAVYTAVGMSGLGTALCVTGILAQTWSRRKIQSMTSSLESKEAQEKAV